jgi:hypothetical protein
MKIGRAQPGDGAVLCKSSILQVCRQGRGDGAMVGRAAAKTAKG